MPLAKIHVLEGRYDHNRLAKVSGAIQAALMNTLRRAAGGLFSTRLRIAEELAFFIRPDSSACTTATI